MYDNGAELQPVDHPRASPIQCCHEPTQVVSNRVGWYATPYAEEMTMSPNNSQHVEDFPDAPNEPDQSSVSEVVAKSFRPRKRLVEGDRNKGDRNKDGND